MSQTADTSQRTQCIESECEADGTRLEQAEDSHRDAFRLVCPDHAGDESVDLTEFNFRRVGDESWHPSLQRLSLVSNVRELQVLEWEREAPDNKTASMVIRHEDGEIAGETERYDFSAIWALVAINPLPDDVDDYMRDEPPEMPEWAEWVHCDPPMEHHAEAVRCSECGEENTLMSPGQPSDLQHTEWWEHIRHRGDCSHASERDEKFWHDRQLVEAMGDLAHPSAMALDCIWDEIDRWEQQREQEKTGHVSEEFHERVRTLEYVLKRRLDPNYPSCSVCGGDLRRDGERTIECTRCNDGPTDADYDLWWDRHARIWGRRGHGDRGVTVGRAD